MQFSSSTCGCLSKANENSNRKRYLPAHVHRSIYSTQDVETTSVGGKTGKEDVVCLESDSLHLSHVTGVVDVSGADNAHNSSSLKTRVPL